jgi:hypothetical protein
VTTFAFALMGPTDSVVMVESLFEAGNQVIEYGRSKGTVRANGNVFDIPESGYLDSEGRKGTGNPFRR